MGQRKRMLPPRTGNAKAARVNDECVSEHRAAFFKARVPRTRRSAKSAFIEKR